jgi:hypothetical protein
MDFSPDDIEPCGMMAKKFECCNKKGSGTSREKKELQKQLEERGAACKGKLIHVQKVANSAAIY